MRRRRYVAASAGALGLALILLPLVASRAGAQTSQLAGLSMTGLARGLQIQFGFQDFVLGNVVDIGIPHAATELPSGGASGTARAVASQVYPGDIVAGVARESFPGLREANYPQNPTDENKTDADDDAYTIDALSRSAGPLTIETSRLRTHAAETAARAQVSTQRFALGGEEGAILEIASLETFSDAVDQGNQVVQQARATLRDIALVVSDAVTVKIGEVRSEARSSSDGTESDATARFTVSDVEVVVGGQRLRATIDQDGLHLEGFPEQVPSTIPQTLSHQVSQALDQAGIAITTATPVKIVEGGAADASVGGLLITVRGKIPSFFTPQQVKELQAQLYDAIPPPLQQVCPEPTAPLCITPQIVPGPGQGFVTSLAIGSVRAAAAAAKPFELGPVGPPLTGDFGGGGDLGGGAVTEPGPGFDPGLSSPPGSPAGGGGGRTQLFGRIARMPAVALLVPGAAFLILAVALAMGPSLRRWRLTGTP